MKGRPWLFILLAGFAFNPSMLKAQNPASLMAGPGSLSTPSGDEFQNRLFRPQTHKVVGGRVLTPEGKPVVHANVMISNNEAAPFHFLVTDDDGVFRADYNLFDEVMGRDFIATIKVTKKGFQVAYRITPLGGAINNASMNITLHPVQPEDQTVLSLDDLVKGVAPRLRHVGLADGLVAKEEKDYAHGAQDFLDHDRPDRAVFDFTKVVKLSPSCLKCRTMLALAELSWGDWDGPRHELVESVNAVITDPKTGSAEPLLTYGVLLSWEHNPQKASTFLMGALKYSPQDSLVLQELGRAECQEFNWYSGNETLKKALAAGAGPEARLLHAEALLWAESPAAAQAELDLYAGGRYLNSAPPRARALQERIRAAKKDQTIILAAKAKAQARGQEPLDYLHHPPRNLPDFEPAPDQAQLDAVLAAVGKNVSEFFADLPNICSIERVNEQRLNREGKAGLSQEYKYRYLALAPSHPWGPSIDEYRADWQGKESPQLGLSNDAMLTEGFVSAPLVFHPAYQSGSTFRLLGRQKVKGRNTFVLAYAQLPAKSALSGTFEYGNTVKPTYTQGIAWIDAENYQIIRLTSDLLEPLPQVRLDRETTDINFSEVHFQRLTQGFWLPQTVAVTLDWNGRVYRNNHAYSDFLVSNVDETQRIGKPKEVKESAEDTIQPRLSNDAQENPALSLVPPAN